MAEVTYDVKVLLDRLEGKVDRLQDDVNQLKLDRARSSMVANLGGRVWVGVIAVLGIVVNIPAAMYFLGGTH